MLADRRLVADRSRWRELPVRAGGIQVHSANLLHSSKANRTDRPRSALQLWYRAADNVQVGGSSRSNRRLRMQVRGIDPGDRADGRGNVQAATGDRGPPLAGDA